MNRNEHAGKKKGACQHTRPLVTRGKKGKKENSSKKGKTLFETKRETGNRKSREEKSTTASPGQAATRNKADEAIQPTSGAATIVGFESF